MDKNHNKSDNIESGVVQKIVPVGNDAQLPYLLDLLITTKQEFLGSESLRMTSIESSHKITDSGKGGSLSLNL
jgi:hypothetical protein